jgi:hypothetical protein
MPSLKYLHIIKITHYFFNLTGEKYDNCSYDRLARQTSWRVAAVLRNSTKVIGLGYGKESIVSLSLGMGFCMGMTRRAWVKRDNSSGMLQ